MRILLVIVHFFRPQGGDLHGSLMPEKRDTRAQAVRDVIDGWRGHLGPASVLSHKHSRFETAPAPHELDIVVAVNGADHLLDAAFCSARGVKLYDAKTQDPRMLGLSAAGVFASLKDRYDLFIYSEDDLRPPDGLIPRKVAAFQSVFGPARIVVPNRYEWTAQAPRLKTYMDGDLHPAMLQPWVGSVPGEARLELRSAEGAVGFARAGNPHAGFYAITAEQLAHWIAQPHFDDRDVSFVSPLESAATLGMMKTFAVYKPSGADAGWLEIEHLDRRVALLNLPRV